MILTSIHKGKPQFDFSNTYFFLSNSENKIK